MAQGGGLVLLKVGLETSIIGDRTTAEYIAGIAVRCDTVHWAQLSSSSVTSKFVKTSSRFWLAGASGVPVLTICQLLVASCT